MLAVLLLIALSLLAGLRSRRELMLENLALRFISFRSYGPTRILDSSLEIASCGC
jgi:hypothetical protein